MVEEKQKKKSRIRIRMVIGFLVIFVAVLAISYRGAYLEYFSIGEQYVNVFLTNIKYTYLTMSNFIFFFLCFL